MTGAHAFDILRLLAFSDASRATPACPRRHQPLLGRGPRALLPLRGRTEGAQGLLGEPDGGWPPAFQDIVLRSAHAKPIAGRPGAEPGQEISIEIERGKTLIVRFLFLTTGEVREDGTRTVFFELNGQPRDIQVIDRSVEGLLKRRAKGEPDNPDHVSAPMPGKIASVTARAGEPVRAGERLLSIEAMKMETAVYSPRDALVAEVHVQPGELVEARDLLLVLGDA